MRTVSVRSATRSARAPTASTPASGHPIAAWPAAVAASTSAAGEGALADGALQLARRTEWVELSEGQYRGLGQRLLATSGPESGLLQVREIALHSADAA